MGRAEHTSGELAPLESGISQSPALPGRRRQMPAGERVRPRPSARSNVAASRPRKGFRSVLRNRYFLRLWMAQLISQTIMNAANYGLIILIATQSGSVFATGGAIAAFSLPAALFGAPAGVLVDRFDKRRVLWMSNVLRGAAALLFVVSLFINSQALLPVYLLSFFIALVGQFFAPAEGAAIPLLVDEDELVNALGLFNITFTLSQALGLIVMGPLIIAGLPTFEIGQVGRHAISVTPIESLFLLVSMLFFVCALLTASIPRARLQNRVGQDRARPLAREGERLRGIWAGIVECWRFIRARPMLLASVLQLAMSGVVVAVIAEIAPSFVWRFFHLPAKYAALVFIPAGIGLILGSILVPQVVKRVRRRVTIIGLGVVLLTGCTMLLTFAHFVATYLRPDSWWQSDVYIAVVLLLTFLTGIALDLINIPAQTTMQALSPDYIRGRVLAVQLMLYNAITVPIVFLVGLAADAFGLPLAMNVLAVAILAVGLATVVYSARYRAVTDSQPIPAVRSAGRVSAQLATHNVSGPLPPDTWGQPASGQRRPQRTGEADRRE